MKCSKCHAEVDSSAENCPQCGENLTSLDSDHTKEMPLVKKKPMPLWFKILIGITFLALVVVSAGILFTERLVDVVDEQLEALRKGDTETAYQAYTSQEFKAVTSFDQFNEFIKSHPIFQINHSSIFPQRSIIDHITILRGKLMANDHINAPIEYRLIKEEGKWKILSLRLLQGQSQNLPEKRKIIQVTKSLLKNISQDKIEPAYAKYASPEFKDITSLEDFKNLIVQYPIFFQDYQLSFHNPVVQEDKGSLATTLRSDQNTVYLKSYYIYDREEEIWKVSNLRILALKNAN